ncbi:MAG: nitric-oxide synthase, bacterial [Pseudonocardiales bacterium]|nr:nitric-oxide synthase, bacterial [Pseudonocardiales bacterium]
MASAWSEGCPVTHSTSTDSAVAHLRDTEAVDLGEAVEFVDQFHAENPDAGDRVARTVRVASSIAETGTYRHTAAELVWGARVAWRNSARCIGRLYWNSLQVRDLRDVRDADSVAAHCREHLRIAANGGKIRPVITVFAADEPGRPGPQIWNEQLVRYAGYQQPDGSVLGDPRYVGFTEYVGSLGWQAPSEPSAFDVLPLVIRSNEEGPTVHPLTAQDVLEVALSHPEFPWFAALGLRWHAVPAISNMPLRIGGVTYPAAPFNGWYMGTEIGARNLVDRDRYNLSRVVAELIGLDTSSEQTLWRDRAVIEINRAVLHSFDAAGVSIADHHTESARFLQHLAREERAGRTCPADWSWIVPPISGGLTPVFHRYYDEDISGPRFCPDPGRGPGAPPGSQPSEDGIRQRLSSLAAHRLSRHLAR